MEWLNAIDLTEVLIVLYIVVLIVGAKRLPQLGENLRQSIENFRDSVQGVHVLPEDVHCERCGELLTASAYRCHKCRQVTSTGWATLIILLTVAVLLFGLATLPPR